MTALLIIFLACFSAFMIFVWMNVRAELELEKEKVAKLRRQKLRREAKVWCRAHNRAFNQIMAERN